MSTPLSELEVAAISVLNQQDSYTFSEVTRRAVAEATVGRVLYRLDQFFSAQFNAPGATTELHVIGWYAAGATMLQAGALTYMLRRTGKTDAYCVINMNEVRRLQNKPSA